MRRAKQGFRAVSTALSAWRGSIEDFVGQLDADGIPFLSYTKLSTVESCEYRYFLQYVKGIEPGKSIPFVKGNAFHKAASMAYQQMAGGQADLDGILARTKKRLGEEHHVHLANALRLLVANAHQGHEVVATELPFALSLGRGLPPLLGVIDLLLRKGGTFLVVDHKTGKNLYDQDKLQLVLYREYVMRAFRPKRVRACFDEYRWVNNLDRIRKPAFRRTHVRSHQRAWDSAVERVRAGFKRIRQIERTRKATAGGNCMFCPLKDVCEEATVEYSSWW